MKQQANKTKKINMTIDFVAPIEDKMQTCIIPAFLYYITLLARKACEREGEGRDKKKGSLAGFLISSQYDRLHLSYFSSISASTPRSSAGTG